MHNHVSCFFLFTEEKYNFQTFSSWLAKYMMTLALDYAPTCILTWELVTTTINFTLFPCQTEVSVITINFTVIQLETKIIHKTFTRVIPSSKPCHNFSWNNIVRGGLFPLPWLRISQPNLPTWIIPANLFLKWTDSSSVSGYSNNPPACTCESLLKGIKASQYGQRKN